MDYSNKSPIAILSLFLLTLALLLFSWNPITYKLVFFPQNISSNTTTLITHKDELQVALDKASLPNKTLIIAIINKAYVEPLKNEYPTMFGLFLEGFWAGEETRPLVNNLLVVAMDETAYQMCLFRRLNCYRLVAEDGGDKFSSEKVYMSGEFIEMMWRRTLFLLDVLKRGYNFIFTDTDILWLRNPFKKLSNNETLDLQISTDNFNGNTFSENNPINTGFYFIKSNNKTISLFETWYGKRKNSRGMKEQDVLQNLVRKGVFGQLGLRTRFLDTIYFSGFCSDSKNVGLVATVHANCCRTISAKVVDLKTVLRDWRMFKNIERSNTTSVDSTNFTNNFRWSRHVSCRNSWHK